MPALAKLIEPRWERRKDARPSEVTAAALECFVERGFSATRLEDVARRAGVSKGTLYLYFDSKEDLFKAVIREGIVSRIEEAEAKLAAYAGTSRALLAELMHDWWAQIGSTKLGGITKLMMSESGNFPELAKFYHDEVVQRGIGLFAMVIQRGIDVGEFREVPLHVTPRIACAPVIMLMLWRNSFDLCGTGELDADAFIETHTEMLIRALVVDPVTTKAKLPTKRSGIS
jgi:AcrR family transcriptional regulator